MKVVIAFEGQERAFELREGERIVVGRTGGDIALPNDSFLSSVHFELLARNGTCRLEDRNSSNGTFVNGARVQTTAVQEGDSIKAGHTLFQIQQIGVPAGEIPDLLQFLRDQTPCYAIFDAARDPKVRPLVASSGHEWRSLYDALPGSDLRDFAPHLVHIPKESAALQEFVEQGWGHSWGVYLSTRADLSTIWKHFQQWILVTTPAGKKAFFRFQDPRVLRPFLPSCTADELHGFWGPVDSFFLEGETPQEAVRYSRSEGKLVTAKYPLTAAVVKTNSKPGDK